MKNLVKYILETETIGNDWNEKFYTTKENETSIYISNEKLNITDMFNDCKKSDGFIYVSEILKVYNECKKQIIEMELPLEFDEITKEQFETKKQEIINKIIT